MNRQTPEIETILIVDDTPDNLKVLIDLLESSGYRTRVAANGADAVRIADRVRPSLILLDILMPGMDGFDTCGEIKTNPNTADIPVIFLSALADTDPIVKGFEAGGVDFITKPFRREEVLARVEAHVKIQQQKNQLRALTARMERAVEKRKRREAQLKHLHERLDSILRYTPNIIAVMDENGRYQSINPAGRRLLNMTEEEMIGVSCRKFLPPEDAEIFLQRIRTVLKTETVQEVEDRFQIDSREHTFSTTLFPIYDSSGRPSAVGGIAMDITERNRAEQARLQMERRLHELKRLESLGIMAGGIAHDFNNLLMVVQGNIELAKEGLPKESPENRALEASETAVRRAADLVHHLLAYAGKGHLLLEPVDIGALIEESDASIRSTVSEAIPLHFDIEVGLPSIEGDKSRIRQLLVNLIANAAESYDGGNSGSVKITVGIQTCDPGYLSETVSDVWMGYDRPFSESRFVFLEVKDRGCGMDAEARKRLFEPFFTTKFQGRGLGLAAVLGIVRSLNGYIRVDSEPERGTTIRVLLPTGTAAAETGIPKKETATPPAADAQAGSGLILLVDDDDQIRMLVRRMLERLGYQALCAPGGAAALDTFKRERKAIDLVLCDLTMPGMSGLEVLEALRRLDDAVPVILSSGYSEEELKTRYQHKSFSGFLQKPYPMEALDRTLKEVLDKTR